MGVARSIEQPAFEPIEGAGRGVEAKRPAITDHDAGGLRFQLDNESIGHEGPAAGLGRRPWLMG